MEGLNRLSIDARIQARLKGVKSMDTIILTHLLFAYDVIIFLNGAINEYSINSIIQILCKAMGMQENKEKYTLSARGCSHNELVYA